MIIDRKGFCNPLQAVFLFSYFAMTWQGHEGGERQLSPVIRSELWCFIRSKRAPGSTIMTIGLSVILKVRCRFASSAKKNYRVDRSSLQGLFQKNFLIFSRTSFR